MNRMKIFLGCIISTVILSSCGMSEEAKNVKNMIDELPGSYSEDIDEDYKAAWEAYEELSYENYSIDFSISDYLLTMSVNLIE